MNATQGVTCLRIIYAWQAHLSNPIIANANGLLQIIGIINTFKRCKFAYDGKVSRIVMNIIVI